jgi:hypothetical protein
LPNELKYIERTTLVFDDPEFAFEPPPLSPAYFLAPPPEILASSTLAASDGSDGLPMPAIVPLPFGVSVPAPQTDKAPVTSNTDTPTNQLGGQAASSSPILPPGTATDAKNVASPPPPHQVATMAKPPEVTPEEIKPLNQPFPAVSAIPAAPTANQILATARIATLPTMTGDEPTLVPGTEMLAPSATGTIALFSPAIASPPVTGSIPLPIPRPVAMALPAIEGIPLPTPRPVAPAPAAIASQAQPISRPNSDVAAPGGLLPPVRLCPVVNGRRTCN